MINSPTAPLVLLGAQCLITISVTAHFFVNSSKWTTEPTTHDREKARHWPNFVRICKTA